MYPYVKNTTRFVRRLFIPTIPISWPFYMEVDLVTLLFPQYDEQRYRENDRNNS